MECTTSSYHDCKFVAISVIQSLSIPYLSGEHDGDNETVDCNSLAEDDGDEVLRLDPGRLDAAADDRTASGVDTEGCAHDGERHGQPDAKRCPHVWRGLREEPAEINSLSSARELKVMNNPILELLWLFCKIAPSKYQGVGELPPCVPPPFFPAATTCDQKSTEQ